MKISNSVRCKSVFPENFLTISAWRNNKMKQIIVKFCFLFCYLSTEIEGNAGKIEDNFGQVTFSKSFHFNKNSNSTFQIWPKIEEKMKSIMEDLFEQVQEEFEEILEEELENLQEEIIDELSANTEAKIEQKIQEFSEKHNIIKVD